MRKLLLTLAFILAAIPAYAQQATTCATRPVWLVTPGASAVVPSGHCTRQTQGAASSCT